MLGRHFRTDPFGQLKAGAAKSRPRSNEGLVIALAVGGLVLLFTCNPFVKKPSVPVVSGPDVGVVGIPLEFKATSTDPNGDSVAFMFDWGDTTTKVWTDFVLTDETLSVSHTYAESSNYTVKARARNGKGTESGWSSGHPIQLSGIGPGYPDSLVADFPMAIWDDVVSAVVTADGLYLYMALRHQNKLLVMRTSDNLFADTVTVGCEPSKLILSPDGQTLYVMAWGCDSVQALTVPSNVIRAGCSVGDGPVDMVMSPGGDCLYVVCQREDSVARVRTPDLTLDWKIHVGPEPSAIALDLQGSELFITSPVDTTVVAYSTNSRAELRRLKVAYGMGGLAMSPTGSKLYVGDVSSRLIVVSSDLSGIMKIIDLYGAPTDAQFTPDGFYALIPIHNYHGLPMLRTDSDEIVGWLESPGSVYQAAAISPDGNRIYVLDTYRGRVKIYQRRGGSPFRS